MKVPSTLLDVVRGTAVAAAAVGCTPAAPPPVEVAPEPAATATIQQSVDAPPPIDPVSYSAAAEADRLLRADATGWAEARRRERRAEEEQRILNRPRRVPVPRPYPQHIHIACGRG